MKRVMMFLLLVSIQGFADDGGSSIGPSHPSSRLCGQVSGQKIELSFPLGQVEFCKIDHAIIGSMTLWYSLQSRLEVAAQSFLAHAASGAWNGGNPASEYCEQRGGDAQIGRLASGDEMGVCVFNENGHLSMIEEWTLYRGPLETGNQRLTSLLQH